MMDTMWDTILKAAATAGPFGTLLTLFFLYRVNKEREASNQKLSDMTVQGINTLNKVANALNAIEKKVDARRRRGRSRR